MNKQFIASLVGALILFVWQFLSWALIPVHAEEFGYSPNEGKIMEALNQNLTEEGTYFLPGMPPDAGREQEEAYMKNNVGKPWASITYHKTMNDTMGMNMLRAIIVDILAVFLLSLMLLKFANLNIRTAVIASVSVGVIGYLTIPYLHSIWFEGSSLAHLLDALVPWGLVGLWLGWWLTRGRTTVSQSAV